MNEGELGEAGKSGVSACLGVKGLGIVLGVVGVFGISGVSGVAIVGSKCCNIGFLAGEGSTCWFPVVGFGPGILGVTGVNFLKNCRF